MKKLILLLLFIPLDSFGQGNIKLDRLRFSNDAFADTTLETSSINNVFKINNPFLDCDINDNTCFQNLISHHILNNFYYPQLGNYFDIQATVNVNYTIDKNGIVKNVSSNVVLIGVAFEDNESKKVISSAFEKAANSIIESLPKINPSVVNDTALNKKFRTPIHYKLVDIKKGFINSININKVNEGLNLLNKLNKKEFTIDEYKKFGEDPVFPGCEKKSKSKKRDCFQEKMQLHIMQNFKYPKLAQEMAIQGRVFVQFMIGVDGNITRLRARGADPILGKDAERIILLLPKMKPGKVNGFRIRVPFSMPITYTLN
tara:strand:+ start:1 stop:945 length:945 start_codon:yes stop_codon:yes gene_type:complete